MGKRQYTAIFAIGAKLLGSFRAAMNAAQSRLKSLHNATKAVGAGVKTLTVAFGSLFAVFGTFLAANVFKRIFGGASEEAQAAEQRTRSLLVSLMQMDSIRKKGPAEAQKQLGLLYQHNKALQEQGVLHHTILDQMGVQLARGHIPNKQLQETTEKLGDVLVATKGVNASQEESNALGFAFTKAAAGGKLLGLQKQGVIFTKEQQKEFAGLTSEVERYNALMKYLKKNYGDVNKAARNTPVGRIQLFQNALTSMAEEIGDELLPAQAELADAWRAALPELKPLIIAALKVILHLLIRLGNAVRTQLIPWWHEFQKTERFQQIKDVLGWMGKHLKGLAITAGVLVGAFVGLSIFATILPAVIAIVSPVGLIVAGVLALAAAVLVVYYNWDKLKEMFPQTTKYIEILVEGFKKSFMLGFDFIKALWKTVVALFTGDFTGVKEAWTKVWHDMVDLMGWWKDTLIDIAKDVGKAFKDYFLSVFEDIKTIWTWMKGFSWEGIKKAFSGAAAASPEVTGDAGDPYTAAQNAARAAPRPATAPIQAGSAMASLSQVEKQYGLPSGFLSAVAKQEGVNPAYNNPLGLSGPHGPYHYATADEGIAAIEKQARLLTNPKGPYAAFVKSGYKDIDAWARVWSPVGASNDPYGTNNTEASGVRAAMAKTQHMATGGIVKRPILSLLGEKGPEAVVPLKRGATTPDTSVHFNPIITIHGGATEEAQQAMNDKLKDLAREFVNNFKRAQTHERRLSYEGGYS